MTRSSSETMWSRSIPISSGTSMPKVSTTGSSSMQRSSFLATQDRELPCMTRDRIVTRNTMLKIVLDPSRPASTGVRAKRMGPAPFRPTQEVNSLARVENPLNGRRLRKTPNGRATKIRKRPTIRAGRKTSPISEGRASRPSIRNMSNWHNQVMLSKNFSTSRLAGMVGELPMMMAVT